MRKAIALAAAFALAALPVIGSDKDKVEDRLMDCGTAMHEILKCAGQYSTKSFGQSRMRDRSAERAKSCVHWRRHRYGRGAMTCRSGARFDGPWGPPTMMAMEGGSIGFQAGASSTDLVLLVMNDRGARAILENKVKLGADATAAAGPKGAAPRKQTRTPRCAPKCFLIPVRVDYSPAFRWKVQRSVQMKMPTHGSTEKWFARAIWFCSIPCPRRPLRKICWIR